jgi:iron complex outermembrane receptor protein
MPFASDSVRPSPVRALCRGAFSLALALPVITGVLSAQATQNSSSANDIANKSIDELMNVDVTSVSRKEQKLSRTPAAVYVITQEAIERSGANTIPDLLRMAPGVQVAQVEADRWAISVRGFNDIYSNKVLLLIDGRTVYTPTSSGVYWDQIDVPLNTIDRIEIVRGPGGAVWGANAVNGVINIITKNSADTKGTRLGAGAGSAQTGDYLAQHGGAMGSATYRAFGHYSSFGNLRTQQGLSGNDGWLMRHGGFRADWNKSTKDSFMAEGDLFQTDGGQTSLDQIDGVIGTRGLKMTNAGGSVLGLWNHRYSDRSDSALQIYDNYYSRQDTGISEHLNTLDFDYKNHNALGSRNDLVWGAGYRYTSDQLGNPASVLNTQRLLGFSIAFVPAAKGYSLFSTFVQDELKLNENLSLTAGSKFEHNAFTGFQYEPSLRLAWTPTASQTLWTSASMAVRQPSRLDTSILVNFAPIPIAPGLFLNPQTLGNPAIRAETLRDYEIGYRIAPSNRILLDLTSFYSFYRDLKSSALSQPSVVGGPNGAVVSLPLMYANALHAQNYGAEAALTWNVASRWKLAGSYSWLKMNIYDFTRAPSAAPSAGDSSMFAQVIEAPAVQSLIQAFAGYTNSNGSLAGSSPRSQMSLQSYLDLTAKLSFDSSLSFVGSLPSQSVPSYTRLDSRIGWKLNRNITASLVGQNLLSPHHLEFGSSEQAIATQVDRSIFGRIVWSF